MPPLLGYQRKKKREETTTTSVTIVRDQDHLRADTTPEIVPTMESPVLHKITQRSLHHLLYPYLPPDPHHRRNRFEGSLCVRDPQGLEVP
jgi:hypothetical protein